MKVKELMEVLDLEDMFSIKFLVGAMKEITYNCDRNTDHNKLINVIASDLEKYKVTNISYDDVEGYFEISLGEEK